MDFAVKGNLGTFAILGNHDYGVNWNEIEVANQISKILENKGIQGLRNSSVDINGLRIIGLDDYWGPNFNPTPALNNIDNSIPNLVLCHNLDVCDLEVWGDFEGWILSGHTHGGQVKPPFLPPFVLPVKNKKYHSGIIEIDKNRHLYVNRALGNLWQIRFNVRPEITLFELVEL